MIRYRDSRRDHRLCSFKYLQRKTKQLSLLRTMEMGAVPILGEVQWKDDDIVRDLIFFATITVG